MAFPKPEAASIALETFLKTFSQKSKIEKLYFVVSMKKISVLQQINSDSI